MKKVVDLFRTLLCLRCGWKWSTRSELDPVVCPHCKSPYWDREKKR